MRQSYFESMNENVVMNGGKITHVSDWVPAVEEEAKIFIHCLPINKG